MQFNLKATGKATSIWFKLKQKWESKKRKREEIERNEKDRREENIKEIKGKKRVKKEKKIVRHPSFSRGFQRT